MTLPVSAYFKKALQAPVRTPRVLNKPVLVTCRYVTLAITHHSDSMVDFIAIGVRALTVTRHDYTRFVVGHAVQVRVESGTDRLLC
jgi:hypothetical protein